ncbi:hypothetical protein ON010_g5322 [Phytophthora cinnamomi]|nr:hypothetical protein ON010_g5322 [Phytophthora cinnamomi]
MLGRETSPANAPDKDSVLYCSWRSSSLFAVLPAATPLGAPMSERSLVETESLFVSDIEAARRRRIRWTPSIVGYPWVKPFEAIIWIEVEDLFWRYVSRKGYSGQVYKELHGDRLIFVILAQRDLRVEFANLVCKRKFYPIIEELKQQAKVKAREERGRGATASATVPRTSTKKPWTTYETSAASRPRSQQPSGSPPGAVQ